MSPRGLSSIEKNAQRCTWFKYNVGKDITLECLFISFTFCNPTDNFGVHVDGWIFMLADFCEALWSLLLTILAIYSSNTIWSKKADLHYDGANM